MNKNSIKLYNVIFPIWLLWLIPITWLVVLPANFFKVQESIKFSMAES